MADLKDSRLLYEKDLPPFGYMLVSIIAILLIAVLIWSLKTPKTFVIKSQGTIESTNKNYIMSPYTGKISKMNISEGSFVDAGDVLFTVESTELDLQEEQISGQIQVYSENVSQVRYYTITKDAFLYNSWHGNGHASTSTGTPYRTQ